ncbi:MAG: M1 family aminopeptidase, partial [Bacteroidota bacterium]
GSTITTLIYYHGTSNSYGVYSGTTSSGLNYVATVSESYQAREWFPCKQILTDKIDSADIWVTTSNVNKVGSNGVLQGIDALPNSKVRYRWKTIYPMNYYMPSIAVGNYMEYLNYAKPAAIAPDSILIQHYFVNDSAYFNSIRTILDMTPAFIEKQSELYGLYPFSNEKYGHSMATIGGGMEHQTMTTLTNFGSALIAHELGHQWFGDNVTCARWNDIWLNEGFASYSEYLMIEKLPALFPSNNPASYMQYFHSSAMSAANGSVYVPDASVYDESRIFSGRLSYDKGAAIIHNLRFEMQNDNLFFATLKNYQTAFKDSVATAEDFRQVAENTCGRSFTDFFNQWYYGEGYPTINITYFKPNADTILLLVNETTSAPTVTPFFKGLLELKINSLQGDTTVLVNLLANNQVFKFAFNKTPNNITIDPNNWVLNQTGTITNGIIPPVKLLSFKGYADNNCMVHLQWKTTNEINVIKYELEFSNDGLNYTRIASISPTFLINNIYNYDYEKFNSKPAYFRIKMIAQNGNYIYSSFIIINSICKPNYTLEIGPNPVVDQLNITLQLAEKEEITIRIINSIGQTMTKMEKSLDKGFNNWTISNLNKLAAGTYLLQLETNSGITLNRKFIKK